MQIQVCRLVYPLEVDLESILVAARIDTFANYVGLIAWELIFVLVAAVPLLLSYNRFCLVVDVVSRCFQDYAVFDEIGPEHRV